MHENSAILVEDVQDQVTIKDQERKALMAGTFCNEVRDECHKRKSRQESNV